MKVKDDVAAGNFDDTNDDDDYDRDGEDGDEIDFAY